MKKSKSYSVYLFCLLSNVFVFQAYAQNVLEPDRYFFMVKQNHPLAKQAALVNQKAEQYIVKSKGAFDPVLAADLNAKYFNGKNYYSILQNQVKWTSPLGLQLKGGYDVATGQYVNPENSLPENGLTYVGVSLPLGKGLFTDDQRTALKQARLFKEMGIVEREIELNNLFYDASHAYLEWVYKAEVLAVYSNAVKLARERLVNVKTGFVLGDRAAIDTLEAYIQYQSRRIAQQQAEVDYVNSVIGLSNFLWDENEIPSQTTHTYSPPSILSLMRVTDLNVDTLSQKLEKYVEASPVIVFSQYNIKQLSIEQKLLKEYLKPALNVNYNFIQTGGENTVSLNNYKWGIGFYFPLLIRKERANVNLNKIKIKEKEYELAFKTKELESKITQALNAFELSKLNLKNYLDIVVNYKLMLDAESLSFNNGESSLFIVNSRELAYLDAVVKSLEAYVKTGSTYFKILYQLGNLHSHV